MKTVLVEASARHVHLTKEDVEKLFGAGKALTVKRELSQPGQFLSFERVSVVGPSGSFNNVAVLGPERSATQIELSYTDARTLGITIPLRESGDTAGSAGVKIIGPNGEIELSEGAIAAKRHIHITPEEAREYGLKDKEIVSVKVGGERGLIFDNTVVRVSPKFVKAMHIDIDEANAVGLSGEVYGEIMD